MAASRANDASDRRHPKPEVEIWRSWRKSNRRPPLPICSPIACMDLFPAVWPQINYFWFLLPVFKTASRISETALTSKLHRNESVERTKLVRPPVELNYIGWALLPKPEVEIWRKLEKWSRRSRFAIRPPIHYGVYLDFWQFIECYHGWVFLLGSVFDLLRKFTQSSMASRLQRYSLLAPVACLQQSNEY